MTKEEILSKYEYDVHYYGSGRKHILEAMEEYGKSLIPQRFFVETALQIPDDILNEVTKKMATKFVRFILEKNLTQGKSIEQIGMWFDANGELFAISDNQLYDLFFVDNKM